MLVSFTAVVARSQPFHRQKSDIRHILFGCPYILGGKHIVGILQHLACLSCGSAYSLCIAHSLRHKQAYLLTVGELLKLVGSTPQKRKIARFAPEGEHIYNALSKLGEHSHGVFCEHGCSRNCILHRKLQHKVCAVTDCGLCSVKL